MSLEQQLKAYADQSAAKIPQEIQKVMKGAIEDLGKSDLLQKAFKTGDTLPQISLKNQKEEVVSLTDKLNEGKKLVLSFYRGGWCPYCNIQLKALQEILPEIEEKGAELIAITPETPDNSLSTIEKNELSFTVLSDIDNKVADNLNLAYQLPSELNDIYLQFGINLEESQGNTDRSVPLAATYVIDANGKAVYHFYHEDYKLRANPKEILEVL